MSNTNVGVCLSVVADVTLFVLMYAVVNFNMHSNSFMHLLAAKDHALLVFHVEFVDLSICLLSTIFMTLVNMTMLC